MKKDRKEYYLQYKKANYRRVPLDVRPQVYDVIKEVAADRGQTVNGYIKKCVHDALVEQLTGTDKENLLVVLPLLWSDNADV